MKVGSFPRPPPVLLMDSPINCLPVSCGYVVMRLFGSRCPASSVIVFFSRMSSVSFFFVRYFCSLFHFHVHFHVHFYFRLHFFSTSPSASTPSNDLDFSPIFMSSDFPVFVLFFFSCHFPNRRKIPSARCYCSFIIANPNLCDQLGSTTVRFSF